MELLRSHSAIVVFIIAAVVGFLSGLLGKGGSAITTPALQIFAHLSAFSALASPLPSTLPSALSASIAYKKKGYVNLRVVRNSLLAGIPATLAGSYFSEWFGGTSLMILTALFVFFLGLSFFILRTTADTASDGPAALWKIYMVAIGVGLLSGLLANSGGILFGPLFIRFIRMPTKEALATSLIVSAGLAVPGTLAHWYLGHIDWLVVLLLSVGAVPFSFLGAKTAIRMNNQILERIFGGMLIIFGAFDLFYNLFYK